MIPVRTQFRRCMATVRGRARLFGFPAVALLLGATALIAAAADHAQDRGEPFPGFCFAHSGQHDSGWDENGCLNHRASYSKWVDGECVETGTHCDDWLDGWAGGATTPCWAATATTSCGAAAATTSWPATAAMTS